MCYFLLVFLFVKIILVVTSTRHGIDSFKSNIFVKFQFTTGSAELTEPNVRSNTRCNWVKIQNFPLFSWVKIQNSPLFIEFHNVPFFVGSKFKIHPFLSGQNSPFLLDQNSPLSIGSIFSKRSSLRSQTFLSFRTLHLAYPKLVGTPCSM